jgi:hypothetical protein
MYSQQFTFDIRPVHEGVYQVYNTYADNWHYALYENGKWHGSSANAFNALYFGRKNGPSEYRYFDKQYKKADYSAWRGLAE